MTIRPINILALALAGTAAALVLPLGISSYYLYLVTDVWLLAVAAMSLDLLVGYTGLVSLTHAALFGVATYTVSVAEVKYGLTNPLILLLLALMLTIAVAAVFAAVSLRGRGATFIIITVALNQVVWGVVQQWASVTGGDNGMIGFKRPVLGPIDLTGDVPFYYASFFVFLLAAVVLYAIVRSPFGLALQGIREEPRRMKALGYNTWVFCFAAFLIAAAFAGLSGAFFAWHRLFVSPFSVGMAMSVQMLMMVIVGGRATLFGSLLGATVLVFISNFLMNVTYRWEFVLGALYVLILLFMPEGLVGFFRRLRAGVATRRRPALAGSGGGQATGSDAPKSGA